MNLKKELLLLALCVTNAMAQTNCTLTLLTKKPWIYTFSDEEFPRMEMIFSNTTQTNNYKSEKGEIVFQARYYLSETLQKYFDESKVGTSLTGKYICHEDTVNNSVVNYEIKSFSNNSLTIKRIDDKNATYTNTFYNE